MIQLRKTVVTLLIIGVAILAACSGNQGQSAAERNVNQKEQFVAPANSMTPKQISDKGMELVDKEVIIAGKITHVCHRSGKKCFIVGEDDSLLSMQVFVGGEIDTFPREMAHQKVAISGILKVNKIAKDRILESEKQAQEKMPADTSTEENCMIMERCHSVMNQTAQMKEYMEKNGTDYYPVFYVEGRKYLAK